MVCVAVAGHIHIIIHISIQIHVSSHLHQVEAFIGVTVSTQQCCTSFQQHAAQEEGVVEAEN